MKLLTSIVSPSYSGCFLYQEINIFLSFSNTIMEDQQRKFNKRSQHGKNHLATPKYFPEQNSETRPKINFDDLIAQTAKPQCPQQDEFQAVCRAGES